MDLVTVRNGPQLVPATRFDLEELEKVSQRKPLATTITFGRSLKHWRWFNGLIAVVAEGLGRSRDGLYLELKVKCDYVKNLITIPGIGTIAETQSFSFKAADEIKFTEFRIRAVDILFTDYLPGVNRPDVYQRVEEIMGEPCPW